MTSTLVARLRPSYVADKAAIEAAVQLRDKHPKLTEALNAAIVANNDLKREALDALTVSQAEVSRLTEALKDSLELLERHYPRPARNGQIARARTSLQQKEA